MPGTKPEIQPCPLCGKKQKWGVRDNRWSHPDIIEHICVGGIRVVTDYYLRENCLLRWNKWCEAAKEAKQNGE